MRMSEIISESRSAPLYHSYRNLEHAYTALQQNRMAGTTSQRFWKDGRRRIDNEPDYESSYWMKGVSLTRDIRFAAKWGHVIFVLDQEKLSQRYKIVPFNWMYSIPNSRSRKKEKEEFLILKSTNDDYQDAMDLDDPEYKYFNVNRLKSPEGYIENLDRYLKGIYIMKFAFDIYENNSHIREIMKHPLYRGILNDDLKLVA